MSKEKEEDAYNSFEHREVAHPLSNVIVYIHMVKGCVGTGILALPEALKRSGLIVGTVIIIFAGVILIHCMLMIVRVQNDRSNMMKVPLVTYGQAMRYALEDGPKLLRPAAKVSTLIVDIFLIGYQLGTCVVFPLFVAVNFKEFAGKYFLLLDERIWLCIFLAPMIALNLPRSLKFLWPISQIANVVLFAGIGIIMYFVFRDLAGFENRSMVGSVLGYPAAVGTALFALGPIAVVLALESEMKTPQSFGGWCGVLTLGMTSILVFELFVAFFGYLRYGEETLGSISLNIPQDSVMAHVVRVLYALVIFFSYPIQFYVPFDIMWSRYIKQHIENHQLLYEYMIKIGLIVATFVLAIAIPLLGLFISLVGALFVSCLGIAFPAILEICHCWPDRFGPYKWVLWKDLVILLIGIVVLFAGTISSIENIIVELHRMHTSSVIME